MIVEKFKAIPGYSNYLIREDGQVYNRKKQTFLQGSQNPDGYINIRITDDDGHIKTWGLHRLLGFVFLPFEGSIDDLVINHKDGIKWNNCLTNLEWTTYQGNAEHAGREGLSSKCTPVLVRCTESGEVTRYPSVIECARQLGFTKDAVSYRVRSKGQRVFPERKQYMTANCDESWLVPESIENALLENGRSNAVLVRYLLDDNYVVEVKDQFTLSKMLDVSQATITGWLAKTDQPVLPGFIQLQTASNKVEWREVGDVYLELEKTTGKRAVVAWNNDIVDKYTSAAECAITHGLSPTALNYRLSTKGQKRFNDGRRYAYYSDFIQIADGHAK